MEHSEASVNAFRQNILTWAEDNKTQSPTNVSTQQQETFQMYSQTCEECSNIKMLKQQQQLIQKQQKQLYELSAAFKTSSVNSHGLHGGNQGGARGRGFCGRGRGNPQ